MPKLFKSLRTRLFGNRRKKYFPSAIVIEESRPNFTLSSNPRILFLKVDHIGDLIFFLPAAQIIRNCWPSAHITLVCAPANIELANESGIFDSITGYRFLPEHPEDVFEGWSPPKDAIFHQDHEPFDLAVDFRHDIDSRFLLLDVKSKFKAGFTSAAYSDVYLDISLPQFSNYDDKGRHALHNSERLMLLASFVVNKFKAPETQLSHSAQKRAHRHVIIAPGSGASAKNWPASNFALLINKLAAIPAMRVTLVGSEREIPIGEEIVSGCAKIKFENLIGKTRLTELPKLIAEAALFIGNDSGVTHMSAALGTPTICIFSGVANLNVWRPKGTCVTTIAAKIECSPCSLARRRDCYNDSACLTYIDVNTVMVKAQKMLKI